MSASTHAPSDGANSRFPHRPHLSLMVIVENDASAAIESSDTDRSEPMIRICRFNSDASATPALVILEAARNRQIGNNSSIHDGDNGEVYHVECMVRYTLSAARGRRAVRRLERHFADQHPAWTWTSTSAIDGVKTGRIQRARQWLRAAKAKTAAKFSHWGRMVDAKTTSATRLARRMQARFTIMPPDGIGSWMPYAVLAAILLYGSVKYLARDESAYGPWLPPVTARFSSGLGSTTPQRPPPVCPPSLASVPFPSIDALTRLYSQAQPYLGAPFLPPTFPTHADTSIARRYKQVMAVCFHEDKLAVRMRAENRTDTDLALEKQVYEWGFDMLKMYSPAVFSSGRELKILRQRRYELDRELTSALHPSSAANTTYTLLRFVPSRNDALRTLVPLQHRLLARLWQDVLPASGSLIWRIVAATSRINRLRVAMWGKDPSMAPPRAARRWGYETGTSLGTFMWPPALFAAQEGDIGWTDAIGMKEAEFRGEWRGEVVDDMVVRDLMEWTRAAWASVLGRARQEILISRVEWAGLVARASMRG